MRVPRAFRSSGVDVDLASGEHLRRSEVSAALLQFEFATLLALDTFSNWVVDAHEQVSGRAFRFRDLALLHCIRLCGPPVTLSRIRAVTQARAIYPIRSALNRLSAAGLIHRQRAARAREPLFGLTAAGVALTSDYDAFRERTLVALCSREAGLAERLPEATAQLVRLVALYRQATRSVSDSRIYARATNAGSAAPRIRPTRR